MNGSKAAEISLEVGYLKMNGGRAPLKTKVLEGELWLRNMGSQEFTFLRINLACLDHGTLLSDPYTAFPRLAPGRSAQVPFRAASLRSEYLFAVKVDMRVGQGEPVSHNFELEVPGARRVRGGDELIFISYCSADIAAVRMVVECLRARQRRIWIAENDILQSQWFPDRIHAALAAASHFLLFVSGQALQSPWVRDELELAEPLAREGGLLAIVPVLLADGPGPEALARYRPIPAAGDPETLAEAILARLAG